MNKSSLVGILLGWGIIFGTIRLSTPDILMFWDFPSFLLVIIGPYFAMLMGFSGRDVNLANKQWLSIFKSYHDSDLSYKEEIGRLVHYASVAQKGGPTAIDQIITTLSEDDKFTRFGFELASTGFSAQDIRDLLKEAAYSTYSRQGKPAEIINQIGANGPAFGMAGTLIGLVVMLGNMGADPSAIGSGMAVALITTFYGVLAARLIYLPAGMRLNGRNDDTLFHNLLIAEAVALIADRKQPRFIQEKLNAYVDPSERFSIDDDPQK